MGHYLGELYPEGYDKAMRDQWESDSKREKARRDRSIQRSIRARELMTISGEELSQEELKLRIKKLKERYLRIKGDIPVPVTLHLKGGDDSWTLLGSFSEEGYGFLSLDRPNPYHEDEEYIFEITEDSAKVTHCERGQFDLIFSKNSERELRPGEELFDRLITPIEQDMGLSNSSEEIVFG